mgnify:CR=1 FL=1
MVIFAICSSSFDKKVDNVGKFKEKTVMLRREGISQENFVSSTVELIM